jgi:hypothetical protein
MQIDRLQTEHHSLGDADWSRVALNVSSLSGAGTVSAEECQMRMFGIAVTQWMPRSAGSRSGSALADKCKQPPSPPQLQKGSTKLPVHIFLSGQTVKK